MGEKSFCGYCGNDLREDVQVDERQAIINTLKQPKDYEAIKKAKEKRRQKNITKYIIIGTIFCIFTITFAIYSSKQKDTQIQILNIKLEESLKSKKYDEAQEIAEQICDIRNTKENKDKLEEVKVARVSVDFAKFAIDYSKQLAERPKYIKPFYNDVILILEENLKLKKDYNSLYYELKDNKITEREFTQGINTMVSKLDMLEGKLKNLNSDYVAFDEFVQRLINDNGQKKVKFNLIVSLIENKSYTELIDIDKSSSSINKSEEGIFSDIKSEVERNNLDSSTIKDIIGKFEELDSPEKSLFEVLKDGANK